MEQIQADNREQLQERYELALERVGEISEESIGHPALDNCFRSLADFTQKLCGYYAFVNGGAAAQAEPEQLQT
ncbi:MAG: hypothetical protein K2O34_12140, partial [Acetatifactor sp.]|nr:hypothetical protein [Acetatifactor sp.]